MPLSDLIIEEIKKHAEIINKPWNQPIRIEVCWYPETEDIGILVTPYDKISDDTPIDMQNEFEIRKLSPQLKKEDTLSEQEKREIQEEGEKLENETTKYKRKCWKILSKHLLLIPREQALAIILKVTHLPGDVATTLLNLKDYKKYEALLFGRGGKNKRGGAIRALIKSVLKDPDLSGWKIEKIRSLEQGAEMFKTLFLTRYSNF